MFVKNILNMFFTLFVSILDKNTISAMFKQLFQGQHHQRLGLSAGMR